MDEHTQQQQPPINPESPNSSDPTLQTPPDKQPQQNLKKTLKTIAIVVAGIFVVGVIAAIWGIIALVYMLSGSGHANSAEQAMKPVQTSLEQRGASKICTNGDNGYGIDNRQPWYDTYYEIASSHDLTQKVSAFAATKGYVLQENTEQINYLKQQSLLNQADATYQPNDDYLIGKNKSNKSTMTVEIFRKGSVPLYCSDIDNYGQVKKPTAGKAIVHTSISFPTIVE